MQDSEIYADELDRAAAIQDKLNEQALEQAKANNKPESHPDFDGETCVECGDDMPQVRLQLGKIRCISCQQIRETKLKTIGFAK